MNKIHSFGGDIIKIAGDCCKSFSHSLPFCSNLCIHALTVPSSRSTVICFWEYRETKDSGNLRSCNGMAELVYDAVRCGFQLKDCVTQLKDTS